MFNRTSKHSPSKASNENSSKKRAVKLPLGCPSDSEETISLDSEQRFQPQSTATVVQQFSAREDKSASSPLKEINKKQKLDLLVEAAGQNLVSNDLPAKPQAEDTQVNSSRTTPELSSVPSPAPSVAASSSSSAQSSKASLFTPKGPALPLRADFTKAEMAQDFSALGAICWCWRGRMIFNVLMTSYWDKERASRPLLVHYSNLAFDIEAKLDKLFPKTFAEMQAYITLLNHFQNGLLYRDQELKQFASDLHLAWFSPLEQQSLQSIPLLAKFNEKYTSPALVYTQPAKVIR